MRSRHNGSRTGEWRELTDEEGYGYAQLAETPRSIISHSESTINFPPIPTWMGSGELQHTWSEGLEYSKVYECHYIEIPYSTWLRPLMKPLIVTSGDTPATTTINYLPSDLIDFLGAQGAELGTPKDEDEAVAFENTNKMILSKYTFNDNNPPEIAMLMGL